MIILQFILGIRDSLLIGTSVKRYLFPKEQLTTWQLILRLIKQQSSDSCCESQLIANKTYESLKGSVKFTMIILLLQLITSGVEQLLGNVTAMIMYWPVVVVVYSTFAAGMWSRTHEITQEAMRMELDYYQNRAFAEYQIDEASPVQAINNLMTRVIFSLLFQVQSNLVCWVIVKLMPFPISLLKIPIYALFISIQNISTKIPYKTHLAYYYGDKLGYLVGLNFILSCQLHIMQFPLFTGIFWFMAPFYLLNSIPREPPHFEFIDGHDSSYGYYRVALKALYTSDIDNLQNVVIHRNSYMLHLKLWFNDQHYHEVCDNYKSYLSFPSVFMPSAQKLLEWGISTLHGHDKQS